MTRRLYFLFSCLLFLRLLCTNTQATETVCQEALAGNKQAIQTLIALAETLEQQIEFTPDKILIPTLLNGIADPLVVQWKARQNEPIWILIHFDESLIQQSLTREQIDQLYSAKNIEPFLNTGFGPPQKCLSKNLEKKLERIKKKLN